MILRVTSAPLAARFALMKMLLISSAFFIGSTLLPLCAEEKSEAKADAKSDAKEVAVLKTSAGEMVVEFWPEVAPKTVENFKTLAKKGFYDGTAFHRVIKGFMIQGGDPLTKDPAKEAMWGTGDPGYKVKAEFNDRKHVRGVLSMARSQNPDSAGSQFFICHGDPSFLDGKYTAFGMAFTVVFSPSRLHICATAWFTCASFG